MEKHFLTVKSKFIYWFVYFLINMDAETISYFSSLGLTEYESKAVVSLITKGALQAPDISRTAEIPKTRVYDVLEKLEEKGLVISMEGRPKKYQSVETEKIIQKLIEEKQKEFSLIQDNAIKLKDRLFSEKKEEQKQSILRVKETKDFDRILGQEILKAKKSVIGFTELREKSVLHEALNKAAENKIDIKIISDKKTDLHEKISSKNEFHSLNAFLIDGKKIVLGLDDFKEEKPNYHFAILHNKSLAEALSNHFEKKWNKQ